MAEPLRALATILTALAMVTALAHALEYPGKMRLSRDEYLTVQPIYYPGFTLIGIAEPLAIVALTALLAQTPGGTTAFWLTAAALAAAASTHLLYWVLTAPVNRVWLEGHKLPGSARKFFGARASAGGEDWAALRDRWEWSHIYRAATSAAAFALTVVAGVA